MRKWGLKACLAGGAAALLLAIASLGGRAEFGVTLLYVSCTLAVIVLATGVTICTAARFGKRRPGHGDVPGVVEFAFLIGLYGVSPTALIGAFVILDALVGPR